MATANPTGDSIKIDNYEWELSLVREAIETQFMKLIDSLKKRENELLKELHNILASYHSYKIKVDKENNKKISLERTRSILKEELSSSIIGSFVTQLNEQIESAKVLAEPRMVHFVCDDKKLLAEVNNLGRLVEVMISGIDYKSKMQPVVSVCVKGIRTNELNNARGVIVDERTGSIYVADQLNNCVKAFDSSGNYLFKFGDNKGKMYYPRSVAICENSIFVSQGNHCILCYKLDGEFISKIGKSGKGEVEFNNPLGLTINRVNQDIFICDYYNNRVQVLSSEFKFKSQFGKYTLKFPHDVKISEKYVYVLDESNPCLHLFDSNLILQRSVISRGIGCQIPNSYYFYIDIDDNILISDCISNCVSIFNPQFESFHEIPIPNSPMGVTMDNSGNIIVVSQGVKNCLQMF